MQPPARLFLTAILLLTASCVPASVQPGWVYDDLRLLDPVDETSRPSTDILALYTRNSGSDLEIRIDLLDISLIPDYSLVIYLFTLTDELTILLPAAEPAVLDPGNPRLIPRLVRNPWLDTVTVYLNRLEVPQPFVMQVSSYIEGKDEAEDVTTLVRSDGLPPSGRAALLLAFQEAYPAFTPAQALRRWDGAHSGPLGGRHGLKHIIDNARRYAIPVALLDLKNPASLAALDYMSVLSQIKDLERRGLLLLPDAATAEPFDVSLALSRKSAKGFGLHTSPFAYSASGNLVTGYQAQFLQLNDGFHLSRSGRMRLIPLPGQQAVQITEDGPSLEVRQALVDAALSTDPADLVVLGGALPRSMWGNESMASTAFAWIAAHPWIQPLSREDLLTFPIKSSHEIAPAATLASALLEDLQSMPANAITDSAWQAYLMLNAPAADIALTSLREKYFGQVYELLEASRWAENPTIRADCGEDLDKDGLPECILANQAYFAILDPLGARLTNFFWTSNAGTQQIIAPSSQFTVGLSDPSDWRPESGEAADPNVIPGAFSDNPEPWMVYKPEVIPGGIRFENEEGSRVKTFRLLDNGIELSYQTTEAISTRIPLAVDPQAFFFRATHYSSSISSGIWKWGLEHGTHVRIKTGVPFSVESFTDSSETLSQPENPDFAYPHGHYLAFPLSVVSVQGEGSFVIKITTQR